MADDRPVLTPEEEIAALRTDLEDLRSTILARTARLPTGTICPYVGSALPDTNRLFLQGQTVSRETYGGLWQWANDVGAVVNNLFEPGDGSTNFVLPDFRGKVLIGVGTDVWDTYTLGEAIGEGRVTLSINEMPAHDHGITGGAAGGHDHGATGSVGNHYHDLGPTGSIGNHGGHNAGSVSVASALPGSQDFFFSVASTTQNGGGGHNHSNPPSVVGGGHNHTTGSVSNHTHAIDITNTGNSQSHENRQPSLAVNWVIWT